MWLALLGGGIGASAVLTWRDEHTPSDIAGQHPLVCLYFLCHFLGIGPRWLDPLSQLAAGIRWLRARKAVT